MGPFIAGRGGTNGSFYSQQRGHCWNPMVQNGRFIRIMGLLYLTKLFVQ